jgi:hypothetical protein
MGCILALVARAHNSKIRSDLMTKRSIAKATYVAGAFLSFLLSVYLWFNGNKEQGLYVGLWVPSILSFGTLILGGRHD